MAARGPITPGAGPRYPQHRRSRASTSIPQSRRPFSGLNGRNGGSNAPLSTRGVPSLLPAAQINAPSPNPNPPRRVDVAANWQGHRGIGIILGGLPSDITTLEISNSFSSYNLTLIEIFDGLDGKRTGRAQCNIEPPPRVNPWLSGKCTVNRATGKRVTVTISVQKILRADNTRRSPLDNMIPIQVSMMPTSIWFGMLINESTMMGMRQLHTNSCLGSLKLTVNYARRKLDIDFTIDHRQTERARYPNASLTSYKIVVRFNALKKLYRVDLNSGNRGLLLALPLPPQFLEKKKDIKGSHSPDKLTWSAEQDAWFRQVGVMISPSGRKDLPLKLHMDDDQIIDIGRWTTYFLELGPEAQKQWARIDSILRDFNIKSKPLPGFSIVPKGDTNYWTTVANLSESHTSSQAMAAFFNPQAVVLPFEIRYQIEVCISNGVFNEHNISHEFLTKLLALKKDRARIMLECLADDKKPIYDPMSIFDNRRVIYHYPLARVPSYCTLMRKAVVTPTTVYFSTPTVETTNRVLRKYSALADRFLRVQFTDELSDGRIRASSDSERENEVLLRVFRTLKNGIIIGNRHYEFLAFGNSQIRENGAYFFCPTSHVTCDRIRQWMGDLGNIRCVAKYAARMGQCFSTTRQVPGINIPSIVKIPDIERRGFCFTDGVGKISDFLANLIAHDFELDDPPSVFQFRMGGSKGVLASWPDVKPGEVHIRESQEKFSAIYNGIEIIKWSTFSTATLNRQTITVLSALGVKYPVFEGMLKNQLASYEKAMEDKKETMSLLGRFIDQNQTTVTMAQLIIHGFMDAHEPFFWTLLRLWRTWSVKALKEKARIVVEKSAFVLGCVDETGKLRGYTKRMDKATELDKSLLPQIFLQVPDPEDRRLYKVITGICLVGRNPSLHPGDLRVVEAVDVPELHRIKNAVVFSQLGDRDVPSMCSGGDLDGDDFFVFWDENLIPPEWNHPPMDYSAAKPVVLNRDVELFDLIQFFVLYMKNDSLPHIAHAHLAQADRLEDAREGHVKHPKCLELAALHSQAVDYVKTGVPAEMPRRLQPRKWPHFMEKHKGSYQSTQPLGKLYDLVRHVEFEPAYEMPFDKRILNKFKLDKETLRKARQLKSKYDTAMRQLMGQNEINTEFEAWSGFVLTKPRVGSDYKRQEDVGRESSALKARFVTACMEAAGIMDRCRDPETLDPFVAAMYQVTNEEVQIARHESKVPQIGTDGTLYTRRLSPETMPLISFPWLFHRELGRIAMGKVVRFTFGDYFMETAKVKPMERTKRESLDPEDVDEMEYIRTNDGQVMHRGEILNLFKNTEDEDDMVPMNREAETSGIEGALGNEEPSGSERNTAQSLKGDLPMVAGPSGRQVQSPQDTATKDGEHSGKAEGMKNSDNGTPISAFSSAAKWQPLLLTLKDAAEKISKLEQPSDQFSSTANGQLDPHESTASAATQDENKDEGDEEAGICEVEVELEIEEENALERAARLLGL